MQQELVQRARNGDHVAFESLVRPEIGRLFGLAGLLLADRTRAEDAVQEGLMRAWRDLPKLRELDKFGAWLRRLVVNAAHDEGRRLGRRKREVAWDPAHDPATPDGISAVLDRDEVSRAFRRLKDEERTVIALRYFLDLTTVEAAATLGIREVTYRSKLHRAIRVLGAAIDADARAAATSAGRVT